mgnify:CR=1 FL=1
MRNNFFLNLYSCYVSKKRFEEYGGIVGQTLEGREYTVVNDFLRRNVSTDPRFSDLDFQPIPEVISEVTPVSPTVEPVITPPTTGQQLGGGGGGSSSAASADSAAAVSAPTVDATITPDIAAPAAPVVLLLLVQPLLLLPLPPILLLQFLLLILSFLILQ